MKRSSPEQVQAWRRRSKPLKRKPVKKRLSVKKRDRGDCQRLKIESQAFKQAAREQRVCALCGRSGRPWEAHHVVTKSFLKREGFDLYPPDDALRLCTHPCHENHTNGSERLPLSCLLDRNVEYAALLLGPGKAYNYLTRHYTGTDPRVEGLLKEAEYE